MKLYIVAGKKDVIKRWERFSFNYSVEKYTVDQLRYTELEPGIGLVHLDSVDEQSINDLCINFSAIKWVGFADYPTDYQGLMTLEKGFRGYINTYVTESIFKELLVKVAGNDIWAGPSLTQKLLKQFLGSRIEDSVTSSKDVIHLFDFTDREEEVVKKVIEGASNKEVAKILGITERTVKAHMSSILRKTGTTDRISLIIKLTQQSA